MSHKAIIHTDGGARGNPGPAGIGVVIETAGGTHQYKKYIGETTNNQAEYQAVILALEKALEHRAEELDIFLDSELVQRQLSGTYKVKHKDLAPLFLKVWNLAAQFKKVRYIHVYRSDNTIADMLVNEAIDEALG